MAKEKILLVEDEDDIRELVKYNLSKDGFRVTTAASGEEGLKLARAQAPDLVLLDLMLPGIDGLEVCKILRNDPDTAGIKIVMLTAKGEEADVVSGLELGADDYIAKPFSPRVLVARLRAILRRTAQEETAGEQIVRIKNLTIDPGRHEVLIKDRPVTLTFTEFRLLHFLARRPGRVFTRQQIVNAVRGEDYPVTDRAVDVQVVGLRKKLEACGEYIETVRGVGYKFAE